MVRALRRQHHLFRVRRLNKSRMKRFQHHLVLLETMFQIKRSWPWLSFQEPINLLLKMTCKNRPSSKPILKTTALSLLIKMTTPIFLKKVNSQTHTADWNPHSLERGSRVLQSTYWKIWEWITGHRLVMTGEKVKRKVLSRHNRHRCLRWTPFLLNLIFAQWT